MHAFLVANPDESHVLSPNIHSLDATDFVPPDFEQVAGRPGGILSSCFGFDAVLEDEGVLGGAGGGKEREAM